MKIALWKTEYHFFLLPTLCIADYKGISLVLFLFDYAIGIKFWNFNES